MTLRELLNYIEFDMKKVVNDEGKTVLKFIDMQDVYLGTIGDEEYEPTQESVPDIIDRCEIYWNDYVITPLCEDMGVNGDDMTWEEIYDFASKYYGDEEVEKNTVLGWIVNPKTVTLDEELKG